MTKIAILSTAHIHTPGFVRHLKERPDIQVAAVYDPNPVLAQKYATELNVPVADSAGGHHEQHLADRRQTVAGDRHRLTFFESVRNPS